MPRGIEVRPSAFKTPQQYPQLHSSFSQGLGEAGPSNPQPNQVAGPETSGRIPTFEEICGNTKTWEWKCCKCEKTNKDGDVCSDNECNVKFLKDGKWLREPHKLCFANKSDHKACQIGVFTYAP